MQQRNQCWDKENKVINKDDVVKVTEGKHQGKRGTILQIHKNILFLHN